MNSKKSKNAIMQEIAKNAMNTCFATNARSAKNVKMRRLKKVLRV